MILLYSYIIILVYYYIMILRRGGGGLCYCYKYCSCFTDTK